MFLRHKVRRKDGKEHRYWSIVENRRVAGGRTMQRHVLYLGEINDSQKAAWCQTIEAFDEGGQQARQIALFPEDRAAPALDCDVVSIRLSQMRLRRPRQWGACWMATLLWDHTSNGSVSAVTAAGVQQALSGLAGVVLTSPVTVLS